MFCRQREGEGKGLPPRRKDKGRRRHRSLVNRGMSASLVRDVEGVPPGQASPYGRGDRDHQPPGKSVEMRMDGGSAWGEKNVIRAVARHIALKLRPGRLEARRDAFSAYCKLQ